MQKWRHRMNKMRITKLMILALVLLFVGSLTLFAAGGKESQSNTGKPTVLRFSWWGADTRHQATLEAMDLYHQRNPNIILEGEYGAFSDAYQKLLTQLAGKTAPDVVTIDYKWVSDLMNQGAPFVNMLSLSDVIDQSGFDETFAKNYGGNDEYLIGLPVGLNGM